MKLQLFITETVLICSPTIVDRSEFPVHIFTRLSSEKCEHDAYIISNASYKGKRDYCLQLSSSG